MGKMSKFVDLGQEKMTSTLRRNFWRGYSIAGGKQKGIRQYDHINLSTWLRLTVNTTRFLNNDHTIATLSKSYCNKLAQVWILQMPETR